MLAYSPTNTCCRCPDDSHASTKLIFVQTGYRWCCCVCQADIFSNTEVRCCTACDATVCTPCLDKLRMPNACWTGTHTSSQGGCHHQYGMWPWNVTGVHCLWLSTCWHHKVAKYDEWKAIIRTVNAVKMQALCGRFSTQLVALLEP